MNIFQDQAAFIAAMGQTHSREQAFLYMDLVDEEHQELSMAMLMLEAEPSAENLAEVLDGAIDLIYVAAGLINSLGIDGEAAWNEVHRSNMSKMGPDGKVMRRPDGKILKGPHFSPPNLLPFVTNINATLETAA